MRFSSEEERRALIAMMKQAAVAEENLTAARLKPMVAAVKFALSHPLVRLNGPYPRTSLE